MYCTVLEGFWSLQQWRRLQPRKFLVRSDHSAAYHTTRFRCFASKANTQSPSLIMEPAAPAVPDDQHLAAPTAVAHASGAPAPNASPSKSPRPFGLPTKPGVDVISKKDWDAIAGFIRRRKWLHATPCLETDMADPLLNVLPKNCGTARVVNGVVEGDVFGAFMMGFDFHLTPQGPRLIEINTNAGEDSWRPATLTTIFVVLRCCAHLPLLSLSDLALTCHCSSSDAAEFLVFLRLVGSRLCETQENEKLSSIR